MARCDECIHSKMCAWNVDAENCAFFKTTADVVVVIRCKDCKFADMVDKDTMFCRRKILGLVTDESFCSFARRKE